MPFAMNVSMPFGALILRKRRYSAILNIFSPSLDAQAFAVNDCAIEIENDTVPFVAHLVWVGGGVELRVCAVLI